MRKLVPLLLAAACASTPAGPAGRGPGDACRAHTDCPVGLVCEEETGTCAQDECAADDCDRDRLGAGRCETVEGVTYAKTCTYDGVRCFEWAPQACGDDEVCEAGAQGATCHAGG